MSEDGTQGHDPDFPDRYLEFMRARWADSPLAGLARRPEAAHHAKRRATIAAGFPGETLVIPSGGERVRANDTNFRFRPGSDHVWLTGEHDPDSVLVVQPDGEAVLYARPRSAHDDDSFFRDRVHGELWIGRRRTLEEKSEALGVRTAHLDELPAALDAALADGQGPLYVLPTYTALLELRELLAARGDAKEYWR